MLLDPVVQALTTDAKSTTKRGDVRGLTCLNKCLSLGLEMGVILVKAHGLDGRCGGNVSSQEFIKTSCVAIYFNF